MAATAGLRHAVLECHALESADFTGRGNFLTHCDCGATRTQTQHLPHGDAITFSTFLTGQLDVTTHCVVVAHAL
jgi:hypothetical protein